MGSGATHAEALREHVARTITRSTDLIADLNALADGLDTLRPDAADRTQTERWREAARLAGLDESTPERLEALVEALADVLAGLTAADNGSHWLAQQGRRLASGEDVTAA
jgi:hypothetical protein